MLGRVCESSGAMEVLNGDHQEVVVVAHAVFEDLVETARGADKLREAMSYLLAAARAGVHIPSETMDKLGLTPMEIDAEASKVFRAHYPLTPTHGEDGEPLAAVPVSAAATAFEEDEEDEEELVFVEQHV